MDVFLAAIYFSSFLGVFTSIFYLLAMQENNHKLKTPIPNKLLSTTVLVPAFNEQGRIERTVKSLLNLDYPKHLLEILLIDDGSKDNTLKEMQEMQKLDPKRITVIHKENGGKASALNLGIKKAKGEIIVSLDADSFVDKNALKNMIGYFNNKEVAAVTPSMKIWKPKSILQFVQFAEYMFGVFLRKATSLLDCLHVTPGPFSAYRKSFFVKHGGYEEGNPTEDMELAMRIQSKNYVIEHSLNSYSYTPGPSKFIPLFRQRLRWYFGYLTNLWKYRKMFANTRYGTFGMFYLPMATTCFLLPIFIFMYVLKKTASALYDGAVNLLSINFDFTKLISFKLDSYYFMPSIMTILVILAFVVMLTMVLLGRMLSKDKERIAMPFIWMMVLYAPLHAIWWSSALVQKARGKKIRWSGISWKKD
ncbi:glycosyltransferase family 2 protein [Candidatus Woesearchaeota archaeon]|nr:glycosyltransferase family 2 protein [Candidatus Woesearchaeota archaeon]